MGESNIKGNKSEAHVIEPALAQCVDNAMASYIASMRTISSDPEGRGISRAPCGVPAKPSSLTRPEVKPLCNTSQWRSIRGQKRRDEQTIRRRGKNESRYVPHLHRHAPAVLREGLARTGRRPLPRDRACKDLAWPESPPAREVPYKSDENRGVQWECNAGCESKKQQAEEERYEGGIR